VGISVQVRSFEERATSPSGEGGNAQACAFMELAHPAGGRECYGVGIDTNIVTASLKAVLSGINRLALTRSATAEAQAA
jgi:2-isopropylmalate synthase